MATGPDDGGSADRRTDPNEPFASQVAAATQTTELADGRALAFASFGDPDGVPVFVFHGGIGSRGFGLLFDEAARAVGDPTVGDRASGERASGDPTVGARIVAPDRPGFGLSDRLPGRRLVDWPADVAALADAVGAERFAVLGVSGGGPYAAACAAMLPDRVVAAALVSSMPPPGAPRPLDIRAIVALARYVPAIPRFVLGRQLRRARDDPAVAIEARAAGGAEPEAAMHRSRAGRILNASTAEAGRQGPESPAHEIAISGRRWGFDLGDVAVPVGVWHGALDRTIPVESSRYLASAIPDARLTVHEDVGHLSLPVTYADDLLGFLLDADD